MPTRDQVLQNDIRKKKKEKKRKEEKGKDYKEKSTDQKRRKKIKDMSNNMTPIFLLSCSESSLPAM